VSFTVGAGADWK